MSNGAARNARESPEFARNGELTAATFLARGVRQRGSGRVHSARSVAVDVMLGFDSEKAMADCESYFDDDYLLNQREPGDDVVDKVGVLADIYNFANWSKS